MDESKLHSDSRKQMSELADDASSECAQLFLNLIFRTRRLPDRAVQNQRLAASSVANTAFCSAWKARKSFRKLRATAGGISSGARLIIIGCPQLVRHRYAAGARSSR